MPAQSTYEPIATFTVTGSTSIITFNSIPGTYTDLKMAGYIRSNAASASSDLLDCTFNSVASGGLYSTTNIVGDGSSASSSRWGSVNVGYRWAVAPASTATTNIFGTFISDIYNYANTTTFKTMVTRSAYDLNGSGGTSGTIMMYRSTAAITKIEVFFDTGALFTVGSNITLYGIASA
jgi:hypothetical protein